MVLRESGDPLNYVLLRPITFYYVLWCGIDAPLGAGTAAEREGAKSIRRRAQLVIRSFLPVGQGAFYLEQFTHGKEVSNIIYDCGSSTDVGIVEKEIRSNFEDGEKIDAVFISHLDEDHVNGLPYLLKYCKVKKIFFPLLTKGNQDLLLLMRQLSGKPEKGFVPTFIRNPHEAFGLLGSGINRPSVYQVAEDRDGQEERDDYNGIDALPIRSGSDVAKEIFGGDAYGITFSEWRYIPFNFRETTRIAALQAAIKKTFGKELSAHEVSELIKKDPNKRLDLKLAYKSVSGSLNTNSLVLLSLCESDAVAQTPLGSYQHVRPCFYPGSCCYMNHANGCLYTGDYDAHGAQKWRDLQRAYTKYEPYIGCIQIPHHGSKYNYNHQLLGIGNCAFFIISAGEKNSFRHPHGSVVRDILASHRYPVLVTENSGSAARFVIY